MKKFITFILALLTLIGISVPVAYAARTESSWLVSSDGTYIYPANALNVLLPAVNGYLNFGTFSGSIGYGFRDFGGVMQFKNSGGNWTAFGSGSGGGSSGGTWSTTTSSVAGQLVNYSNNSTDIVAIGSTATSTASFYFDPNVQKSKIGTVISGVWNGTAIAVANGGTGLTATGASSTVLTTNGTTPAWQKLPISAFTNDLAFLSSITADAPLSGAGTSASHLVISTSGTWSGNAVTASALAANGTNCSAGNYPLGVDASGNSENCTLASTGTVTSVSGSGGTTGLTLTGGPIINSGTLTLGGTLNIANGGTGLTSTGASSTVLTTNGTSNAFQKLATSQLTNDSGFVTGGPYVPTTRILTINGVALDLSADRSWTVSGGGGGAGTFSTSTPFGTTQVQFPTFSPTVTSLDTSATSTSKFYFDSAINLVRASGSIGTTSLPVGYVNTTNLTLGTPGQAYIYGLFGASSPISYNNTTGSIGLNTVPINKGGTNNTTIGASSTIAISNGSMITYQATSTLGLQNPIILTTSGTSGASTFDGTTLNIPQYTAGGAGSAYPFGLTGNATSTLTQFNGGLTAFASSTIGSGSGTALTVSGNEVVNGTIAATGNISTTQSSSGSVGVTVVNNSNGITASARVSSTNDLSHPGYIQMSGSGYLTNGQLSADQLQLLNDSGTGGILIGAINGNAPIKFTTDKNTLDAIIASTTGHNFGIGTSSPYAKLSVAGRGVFDQDIRADYFTSASTTFASTFPYASTTAISASSVIYDTALGTPAGSFLAVDASGKVIATTTPTAGTGTNYFSIAGQGIQTNTGSAVGINTPPLLAALEIQGTSTGEAGSAVTAWNNATVPVPLFSITDGGAVMLGTTTTPFLGTSQGGVLGILATTTAGPQIFLGNSSVTHGLTNMFANNRYFASLSESAANFDGLTIKSLSTGNRPGMTISATQGPSSFNNAQPSLFISGTGSSGASQAVVPNLGTVMQFANFNTAIGTFMGNGSFGIGSTTPWGFLSLNSGSSTQPIITVSTTTGSNLLILDSNGRLGLGTTSPFATLSVAGQAAANNFTATNALATSSFAGDTTFGNPAASSSLVIDYNGRVGIGTSTPVTTLAVEAAGGVTFHSLPSVAGGNPVCIISNGTIQNSGNTTCALSSKFVKHDINNLDSDTAFNFIEDSRPVSFTYNDDGTSHYGFIAEEVNAIDPLFAEHAKADQTIDGHEFKTGDANSIDTTSMIAAIVKYLQGQAASGRRNVEDNWQWIVIALLGIGFVYQQFQIKKLKK